MDTYQMSLFDLDTWDGKTFREFFPPTGARTSEPYSRRQRGSHRAALQFLNLRAGYGNLLGSFWEINSLSLGEFLTRSFGEYPKDGVGSSLSQILQEEAPEKYYLSPKACLGILRRSALRGKELPKVLKEALEMQTGIKESTEPVSQVKAFHINQRNEGIDLNNVAGALLATQNNQMQTFVTQKITAFSENQRNEIRDLHNISGCISASPGTKQQTFIAAFCQEAGADSRGIGYDEEISPTLRSARSPSVVCLNDEGGKRMNVSNDITGTLKANMGGHQPIVMGVGQSNAVDTIEKKSGDNIPLIFENHGIDSRYTGPLSVSPTIGARCGTGGNNVPLVGIKEKSNETYCIAGNTIDRLPINGGNGSGVNKDIAYTLTGFDRHAVFNRSLDDRFKRNDVAGCECARQYKDATDLVLYAQDSYSQFSEGCATLRASGGTNGGGSESLVTRKATDTAKLIRRLTPLECERLQGFPDHWTNVPTCSDSKRYKALGNSVAIPCVEYVLGRINDYEREETNEI